MTDSDLETDSELTARVRAALAAVADATPLEGPMPAPAPRRHPFRLIAAVAAAATLLVGTVSVVSRGAEDTPLRVGAPGSSDQPSSLPNGFDVTTATPLFSADGSPDEVGLRYLRDRFPDFPAPGVTADAAQTEGDSATVRWRTGDDGGEIASGELYLRRSADRWAVVAAGTDGVDLSSLTYDGTRVAGTVRTTSDNSLFADVLDWQGQPVHRAPRPEGQPGAAYRLGTAGGPSNSELDLDVMNPRAPAVVRVSLVGGTVLSVSEVRFDPPALPAHRDLAGCVEQGTNKEKEPTPDVLYRACAAALVGEIIGSGTAGDRQWELVASDEPSGHWVTLRSRDQIGVFRHQAGEEKAGARAEQAPFFSLGPCCSIGDHVAMVGALHADAEALRVRLGDGSILEARATSDPGHTVRYAVVTVPDTGARAGAARAEVLLRNGRRVPAGGEFRLTILGG